MEPVTMIVGGVVGTLTLLAAVAIPLEVRHEKRKREKFQEAIHRIALSMGLEFDTSAAEEGSPTFAEANGTVEGHYVHLTASYVGGKNKTPQVEFRTFANPDLRMGLKFGREGMVSSLANKVGIQDIQVGDGEFDRRFSMEADDEKRLLELFDAEVRRELTSYDALTGRFGVHLTDEDVFWKEFGAKPDVVHFEKVVRAQLSLMKLLSRKFLELESRG